MRIKEIKSPEQLSRKGKHSEESARPKQWQMELHSWKDPSLNQSLDAPVQKAEMYSLPQGKEHLSQLLVKFVDTFIPGPAEGSSKSVITLEDLIYLASFFFEDAAHFQQRSSNIKRDIEIYRQSSRESNNVKIMDKLQKDYKYTNARFERCLKISRQINKYIDITLQIRQLKNNNIKKERYLNDLYKQLSECRSQITNDLTSMTARLRATEGLSGGGKKRGANYELTMIFQDGKKYTASSNNTPEKTITELAKLDKILTKTQIENMWKGHSMSGGKGNNSYILESIPDEHMEKIIKKHKGDSIDDIKKWKRRKKIGNYELTMIFKDGKEYTAKSNKTSEEIVAELAKLGKILTKAQIDKMWNGHSISGGKGNNSYILESIPDEHMKKIIKKHKGDSIDNIGKNRKKTGNYELTMIFKDGKEYTVKSNKTSEEIVAELAKFDKILTKAQIDSMWEGYNISGGKGDNGYILEYIPDEHMEKIIKKLYTRKIAELLKLISKMNALQGEIQRQENAQKIDNLVNSLTELASQQETARSKKVPNSAQDAVSNAMVEISTQRTSRTQGPGILAKAVDFLYTSETLRTGLEEIANDFQRLTKDHPIEYEYLREESNTIESWHNQTTYEATEDLQNLASSSLTHETTKDLYDPASSHSLSQEDYNQYNNSLSREDINDLLNRADLDSLVNQYLSQYLEYYNL